MQWFEGADQHAAGNAFRLAGDIEAGMQAVDEVHIRVAGRAPQNGVARGTAREGMRGRVIHAEIGFRFDDAASEQGALPAAQQEFAEQGAGDNVRCVEEEGAGQEFGHGDDFARIRTSRNRGKQVLRLRLAFRQASLRMTQNWDCAFLPPRERSAS